MLFSPILLEKKVEISMFCSNCGLELKEESKFCHSCGTASIVATKTPDSPSSEIPERETQEGRQEFIKEQAEILKKRSKFIKGSVTEKLASAKEQIAHHTSQKEQEANKEVETSDDVNTVKDKQGEEAGDVINAESEVSVCICNHCDQRLEFNKSMAGTVIQCPVCGMETELYLQYLDEGVKSKSKKETVTLQGAEKQSAEFTENQMKITRAYGAIEGVMRKGINAVKQKAKFVSVFIVSVLIISLVFLFVNRESPAEKRTAFGGKVVLSYGMLRNLTENSFGRISNFLENWSLLGAAKLEKVARENPPQKLGDLSDVMNKLRSRKEVDLEMYNSVIELHDISLEIWKLSKSPAGDNQRTYASKAVKLQKKFEPIEARVKRLYDSKNFNSSGISLNQAYEILKKISNN